VDYRSDPIIAVIWCAEIGHLITEFFNRIGNKLPFERQTVAQDVSIRNSLLGASVDNPSPAVLIGRGGDFLRPRLDRFPEFSVQNRQKTAAISLLCHSYSHK